MNELKLKEMNQEKVVYLYQPEGRGEFGEIVYNFGDASAKVAKQASDDESRYYGNKALIKVEELVKKNNLPLKCTQAWY